MLLKPVKSNKNSAAFFDRKSVHQTIFYYCPTTDSQPVPAQVRHGLTGLLLPLPRHCRHSVGDPSTETSFCPWQTMQAALFPGATLHLPVPPHHAHFTREWLFEVFVSNIFLRQS